MLLNLTKKELFRLYNYEKLFIKQIADKLNLGKTTIARYLDNCNIKTRNSKEGQKLRLLIDGKFGGYIKKKLNKIQKQLILGTVLGDGNLNLRKRHKNSRLKIEHSPKDVEYIKFKYKLLDDFVTGKIGLYKHRNKKVNKIYFSNYFITKTHPEFTKFYNQFYKNGKKILTKSILNQLNSFGLSVWIMDDGCYSNRSRYLELYTMNFTEKEHKVIIKWFKERFDINPKICFHKQCSKFYLRFNKIDSEKFVKIIKPYVIKSMSRKIGN